MDDRQLERYSRHLLLPDIGLRGQETLLGAHVLVIGAGGLGCPAAMYLAASGVGRLTLCDHDTVELSNLQRQIAHSTLDIGRPKVDSAHDTLQALNPEIQVTALAQRAGGPELRQWVRQADVVVDASDNFPTRFAVNDACQAEGRPLVSGAVVRWEGQATVFRPDRPGGPCYRCLYPEQGKEEETCSARGVLAPATGIVGSLLAVETIKVLLGLEPTLHGRLLQVDARTMRWRETRLRRDPACSGCTDAAAPRQAAP